MSLSDKALLAQLSISQWTARKYDRKVSNEIATQHNAAVQAGRYHKSLLPMADQLTNVHKKAGLIRNTFYANTVPWGIEGTMILPSKNYLDFMAIFRKEKSEWESIVTEFFSSYDQLVLDAARWRGTMYNSDDYPPLSEIRDKFRMELTIMPVPENDFRVDIPEKEKAQLEAHLGQRVVDATALAMADVWQQLYDKVEWLSDKLTDPNKILQVGAYEGMATLCELLLKLNVADDPELDRLAKEVKRKLASHHPESLRNDPDLRRDTAVEAADIMKAMKGFMG